MYISATKRGNQGEIWFDASCFLAIEEELDPFVGTFLYSTLYLNFSGTIRSFTIDEKAEELIDSMCS